MFIPFPRDLWTLWSVVKRKHLKVVICYAFLFLMTFGVVAPYLFSSWVYSIYFNETLYSKTAEVFLKKSNSQRLEKAQQYLNALNSKGSQDYHQKRLEANMLDVLAIVKTIDRSVINDNPEMGYLTQTVVKLDREIRTEARDNLFVGLTVCNADPRPELYEQAVSLSKFYPTITLEPRSRHSVMREAEKQDYVRCLESVAKFSPRYVLVVEDDAEAYDDMLPQLSWIVRNRLETHLEHGERIPTTENWAFLKLYYPERWSGYSNCIAHILELCGIGCLSGFIFAVVVMLLSSLKVPSVQVMRAHFCIGAAYGLLLALSVGRQHLLQLHRLVPGMVMMRSAPGCCTPATLYPQHIVGKIIQFLSNSTCSSDYGVDLALDDFAVNNSLHRYFVEPNLFHHRGVYSTLTKPKDMAEFLFDT